MTHHDDHLADDVQPVMDLLSVHRPEASALELDAVKRRVLARGNRSPNSRRNGFMRSRAAIFSTLVLGFVLSSTGAGLAVTGFAGNDQAAVAEYPPQPQPESQPLAPPQAQGQTPPPAGNGVVDEGTDAPAPEEQQVLPDRDEVAAAPEADEVQPTRQVTAGVAQSAGDELPFTGFAAIPVLLIGLALLSAGLVLQRSSRAD